MNPLNKKALESQKVMAEIQPKMKEIQSKNKNNKEKQAQEMLALYKEKKFNPFSGIFLLFLQLPIIFALFQIFRGGIDIRPELIYSFIVLPETINPFFFGLDLSKPSLIVAILAAVGQYIQTKTGTPKAEKVEKDKKEEKDKSMQMTEIMQKQMMYILPFMTLFILFKAPSALGIYWLITTIMTIYQQKKILKEKHD
jgi:YidC/Oxa1 family membrane protein insertase